MINILYNSHSQWEPRGPLGSWGPQKAQGRALAEKTKGGGHGELKGSYELKEMKKRGEGEGSERKKSVIPVQYADLGPIWSHRQQWQQTPVMVILGPMDLLYLKVMAQDIGSTCSALLCSRETILTNRWTCFTWWWCSSCDICLISPWQQINGRRDDVLQRY